MLLVHLVLHYEQNIQLTSIHRSTKQLATNPTAFATNTMLGATNPLDTTNP